MKSSTYSVWCRTREYEIGVLYANGQGVVKNPTEAVKWYRLAAKDNNLARYRLGLMYDDGKGVKKDPVRACMWVVLATVDTSTGGSYRGINYIDIKASLNILLNKITQAQRDQVDKLGQECISRDFKDCD